MQDTKPTIVLVPGAWLPSTAYAEWTARLEQEGYPVLVTAYPSFDAPDPQHADVAGDAAAIRTTLSRLVHDKSRDVVLVMHSYGGMPGSSAARGLGAAERRRTEDPLAPRGHGGGILGLVYVTAFIVPENTSCAGMTGGKLAPWVQDDTPGPGLNVPQDPGNMFRHGFTAVEADRLGALCRPHATLAFTSIQPPSALSLGEHAWKGRLGYLKTARDDEIPEAAQDAMMHSVGQDWIARSINGSHMSPFGGQYLEQSIKILMEMIEAFTSANTD
ncbi:hypothetical protein PFICI_13089 [Pestalotiopsis fici W106-1]|uniref:AB hydrolase-1 domain-containing protein n=1 Tax=Pestalotiopsis fici (strain W106-1 / CGMCC3.15140) TaxID=1229662 RepID=W3WL06_PESFW|nr:uncharacterized protein PFICI_13089 [Pestalotiopsis fici W106-1]ETS74605.1 hypothetical protein PFICI_13089 [Pestalotiopsis fici W106-1]